MKINRQQRKSYQNGVSLKLSLIKILAACRGFSIRKLAAVAGLQSHTILTDSRRKKHSWKTAEKLSEVLLVCPEDIIVTLMPQISFNSTVQLLIEEFVLLYFEEKLPTLDASQYEISNDSIPPSVQNARSFIRGYIAKNNIEPLNSLEFEQLVAALRSRGMIINYGKFESYFSPFFPGKLSSSVKSYINMVRRVIEQLEDEGNLRQPWPFELVQGMKFWIDEANRSIEQERFENAIEHAHEVITCICSCDTILCSDMRNAQRLVRIAVCKKVEDYGLCEIATGLVAATCQFYSGIKNSELSGSPKFEEAFDDLLKALNPDQG